MSDLYRDPLVHVHARVKELRARLSDLASQVPADFLALHPEEVALATELAERAVRLTPAAGDANADWFTYEQALAEAVAHAESLVARVPDFREDMAKIQEGRPPAQPYVSASGSSVWPEAMSGVEWTLEKLTNAMRNIDEGSRLQSEGMLGGARVVVVWLDFAKVPLTYTGALIVRAGEYPVLGSSLATYVRRDLPELSVRPEGMLHGIARALGVVTDLDTGDDDFDGTFAVKGAPDALTLLPPAVRATLLEIAKCDVPQLHVGAGLARLTWSYELTVPTFERLVRAAAKTLKEVRSV